MTELEWLRLEIERLRLLKAEKELQLCQLWLWASEGGKLSKPCEGCAARPHIDDGATSG